MSLKLRATDLIFFDNIYHRKVIKQLLVFKKEPCIKIYLGVKGGIDIFFETVNITFHTLINLILGYSNTNSFIITLDYQLYRNSYWYYLAFQNISGRDPDDLVAMGTLWSPNNANPSQSAPSTQQQMSSRNSISNNISSNAFPGKQNQSSSNVNPSMSASTTMTPQRKYTSNNMRPIVVQNNSISGIRNNLKDKEKDKDGRLLHFIDFEILKELLQQFLNLTILNLVFTLATDSLKSTSCVHLSQVHL